VISLKLTPTMEALAMKMLVEVIVASWKSCSSNNLFLEY
jgi:hypothetical protein